ncbi:hypothetical protein [Brevibacterium atlanticum]|uniref:hypothetical protein n=1 Tax=Brevibacterium atlanticum TaxID=2697563 RepID=UPI001D187097|nr:hypothetical protein [Brevibacterium atlanticum]
MYNSRTWEKRDYPRLFRVGEAEAMGISRHHMLNEKRCPVVMPGVRMDHNSPESLRTPKWADDKWIWDSLRLRAAVLKFPNVFADGATAARIFGWPLPLRWMNDHLYLCTTDRNLKIRVPKVSLRRTQHFMPAGWLDLPVLSPPEVLIRLAAHLDLNDLVKAGDAGIGNWHGPPQMTVGELTAALQRHIRVKGRQKLLDALRLIRPGVDSPQETGLRLWTIQVGLPEPTVHPQIETYTARGIIEPDLGYEEAKLALEYEGDLHRESAKQWTRDIERDEALVDAGWTVLKVTRKTDYRLLEAKIRRKLGLQ